MQKSETNKGMPAVKKRSNERNMYISMQSTDLGEFEQVNALADTITIKT